jgi:hypothetical protein
MLQSLSQYAVHQPGILVHGVATPIFSLLFTLSCGVKLCP